MIVKSRNSLYRGFLIYLFTKVVAEPHLIMMGHQSQVSLSTLVKHPGRALMEDIVKYLPDHHIKMEYKQILLEVYLTWQQMQIQTVATIYAL